LEFGIHSKVQSRKKIAAENNYYWVCIIGIYIIGKYIDLRYHPNCWKIIDL